MRKRLAAVVGLDELTLLVGLLLVAAGFWTFWRPGAYLVPGVALVWMALPMRRGFVERPPTVPKPSRRTS